MFKTKFRTLILLFTILTLICTFSFATDAATENVTTNVVTEGATEGTTTTEEGTSEDTISEEDVSYGDVYKFEDDVVIEGVIDGNVFAFGNNITIKEETLVAGDLFLFGEKINIDKSAVYGNLFIIGNEVTVNTEAYDLYAMCGTLNVGYYSVFHREIKAAADTINMNGIVLKNANFTCSSLNLEESCIIYENLNYASDSEVTVPEDMVQGTVNFTKTNANAGVSVTDTILSYVWSLVMALVYTLVIWLFMIKLAPKFTEKCADLKIKKVLPALGLGTVALIIVPVISFVLLLTYVGIPLAFALITLYALIISITFTMTAIFVANLIKNKVNKGKTFVYVILSTLVLWALKQIPYAGGVFSLIITVVGFGIFMLCIFNKNKKETSENTEVIA